MESINSNFWVLIPAYNPGADLPGYVQELALAGINNILVVNDGSDPSLDTIFAGLAQIPQVTLLQHPANAGKGAAIKTGVSFLLENVPGCEGIVTVDADRQHAVLDALAVLSELPSRDGHLVLGCRDFWQKHVPTHNRIGNLLTCRVFRLCYGLDISDTQTGLRGIRREHFPLLLSIPYNRYEYEMEMLIRFGRAGVVISEIPIQTIYIDHNSSSKFNPLKDSLRVYSVIARGLFRHGER